jgi:hypothetical protein
MMEYKKYGEKVSETKKFRVVGFFFLFIWLDGFFDAFF